MKTIREQISVDGSAMNLFSAQPDGSGPLPVVVVIQHQYGVDKFMARGRAGALGDRAQLCDALRARGDHRAGLYF